MPESLKSEMSWILPFSHQMSHSSFIFPKTILFAPNFGWFENNESSNFLMNRTIWDIEFFYILIHKRNKPIEKVFDKSCPGLRQAPLDCPDWLLVRYGRAVFQIKVFCVRINVDSMEILHGKAIALCVGWKFKKRMFLMNLRFVKWYASDNRW